MQSFLSLRVVQPWATLCVALTEEHGKGSGVARLKDVLRTVQCQVDLPGIQETSWRLFPTALLQWVFEWPFDGGDRGLHLIVIFAAQRSVPV